MDKIRLSFVNIIAKSVATQNRQSERLVAASFYILYLSNSESDPSQCSGAIQHKIMLSLYAKPESFFRIYREPLVPFILQLR